MNLIKSALDKLHKRKKINGYYEASDILTSEEKTTLVTVSSIILVPIIISFTLIALSSF